jgi:hypothetical protein
MFIKSLMSCRDRTRTDLPGNEMIFTFLDTDEHFVQFRNTTPLSFVGPQD